MGGKRNWLIAVDEFSGSHHFLKRKSVQIVAIPILIKALINKYSIDVERIMLDNSAENRSLQRECDKQNLGTIFELTGPGKDR